MLERRLGLGIHVDRTRPSLLHRDFWPLVHVRGAVEEFVRRHGTELQGGAALDFGADRSPYAPLFRSAGCDLRSADIAPRGGETLPIDPLTGAVPMPDESFDAVLSTQVLEHVGDVRGYLREARRLLKPNGRLLLTTHGTFRLHRHPTDYRRWTTDGLEWELNRAGFAEIRVVPKMGLLATTTHARATVFGLFNRHPLTKWLPPLVYLLMNCRIWVEDRLSPDSTTELLPTLLIAESRRPAGGPADDPEPDA